MKRFRIKLGAFFRTLKLGGKIQLSFILIMVPVLIVFVVVFMMMYSYNKSYDVIVTNASKAARFSIDFKQDFDHTVYLIIVGMEKYVENDPNEDIEAAKGIVEDLINNTSDPNNRFRAQIMMNILINLERYVNQILANKIEGGHYDDNQVIWERDVQMATSLLRTYVLEYIYYENIAINDLRAQLNNSLNQMTLVSVVVFAALIPIIIWISWLISRSIARPIYRLIDVTNQVAKGDLSVRIDHLQGAEVGELGNALNIMIKRIDQLLLAVKQDQAVLREAELELLQSQINPHFLYNTLDTIVWLAEAGEKRQIVELVGALSAFFRTSLSKGAGVVRLEEEVLHVRSYMQIQQTRYQDILEYTINMPAEFNDALIPKITLQPIVENALYHGIKNKRGMGRITVSARREGGDIVISVADNGIGMTPERLEHVAAVLGLPDENAASNTERTRDIYGLYNVNERIRLRYGREYGITLSSVYGEGTLAQIKIPFQ